MYLLSAHDLSIYKALSMAWGWDLETHDIAFLSRDYGALFLTLALVIQHLLVFKARKAPLTHFSLWWSSPSRLFVELCLVGVTTTV